MHIPSAARECSKSPGQSHKGEEPGLFVCLFVCLFVSSNALIIFAVIKLEKYVCLSFTKGSLLFISLLLESPDFLLGSYLGRGSEVACLSFVFMARGCMCCECSAQTPSPS